MNPITEMIARGWEHFLARSAGPINLRFVIQPTVAIVIAIRAGLKDAKTNRPAYLWGTLVNATERTALLHEGWKDIRLPFLIASALDAIYQIIVHRWIYPIELLFTATILALLPYALLRGPVTRIAKLILRKKDTSGPEESSNPGAKR